MSSYLPVSAENRVVQLASVKKENGGVQFKNKATLLQSLKNTQIKPFKKNIMRRILPKLDVTSKQD